MILNIISSLLEWPYFLQQLCGIIILTVVLVKLYHNRFLLSNKNANIIPIAVNFHFSRKCNYSCGFCFHTAKTSHMPSLADSQTVLTLLKEHGMRKLNFAGGEPFLYPQFLGKMLVFCKKDLQLESVSIVTNGSKVTERFLQTYHSYIDILAVSCDSFDEATNRRIGRGAGNHLKSVEHVAALCRKYDIPFKINTVVNRFNFTEDMNAQIQMLAPFRWKCFQVLVVDGENNAGVTPAALRDASEFVISDAEFQQFCNKHAHNKCFVPEPNKLMASSYLILDEYLRFVDRGAPTRPVLEIGVQQALRDAQWDESGFSQRGGLYTWSKEAILETQGGGCSALSGKELEW